MTGHVFDEYKYRDYLQTCLTEGTTGSHARDIGLISVNKLTRAHIMTPAMAIVVRVNASNGQDSIVAFKTTLIGFV